MTDKQRINFLDVLLMVVAIVAVSAMLVAWDMKGRVEDLERSVATLEATP